MLTRQISGSFASSALRRTKRVCGQGALRGVDQQHGAVDHREPALDLAAEVGVPGSVDDVDLDLGLARPLQRERGVLGEDRDPALALLVARVHDALDDLLVGGECARLAQHRVDQGGLPVVDVRDDRDVPQLGHRGHAMRREPRLAATPCCYAKTALRG